MENNIINEEGILGVCLSKEKYLKFKELDSELYRLKMNLSVEGTYIQFKPKHIEHPINGAWVSVLEVDIANPQFGIKPENYPQFLEAVRKEISDLANTWNIATFFNKEDITKYEIGLRNDIEILTGEIGNLLSQIKELNKEVENKQELVKENKELIKKVNSLPRIIKYLFKIK
jgi:hypothetical protein